MQLEDDDDELGDEDELDSSDDEAGMEQKGIIDEEEEAEKFDGKAATHEGGPSAAMIGADDEEIGIAEARKAILEAREIEEAKKELEELRGIEDDGEAGFHEGPSTVRAAEGASQNIGDDLIIGKKRSRDPALDQETQAIDVHKLKRQKKMQFMNYYRGTFYGKCCSSIFFELAKQLNKVTNDILWWRIVGFYD